MKMRKTSMAKARRGFTLIELLVVISIIGILASLILPAVVNARRQGRRVQCLNNLKNVGTGMFQYVTQKGSFPASGYWNVTAFPNESQDPAIKGVAGQHPNFLLANSTTSWNPLLASNTGVYGASLASYDAQGSDVSAGGTTAGLKYSWVVELLPFIGQQAIYDAWDFAASPGGVGGNFGSYLDNTPSPTKRGNRELGNTYLEVLVCPEDVTSQQSQGSISYVVNGGFAPHWLVQMNPTGGVALRQADASNPTNSGGGWHRENLRNMGLMFLDTVQGGTDAHRRHTLESVRDGASFTAMLSENINAGPGSSFGQSSGGSITSNWACPFPTNTSFTVNPNSVFKGSSPDPVQGELVQGAEGIGYYEYAQANSRGVEAPPSIPAGIQGGINGDTTGIAEGVFPYPNSLHPGGVHVAMCDGGVRFIPENIAGEVWARLVTPNGGSLTRGNLAGAVRLNFEIRPSGITNPTLYPLGNRQVPLSESDIPSG